MSPPRKLSVGCPPWGAVLASARTSSPLRGAVHVSACGLPPRVVGCGSGAFPRAPVAVLGRVLEQLLQARALHDSRRRGIGFLHERILARALLRDRRLLAPSGLAWGRGTIGPLAAASLPPTQVGATRKAYAPCRCAERHRADCSARKGRARARCHEGVTFSQFGLPAGRFQSTHEERLPSRHGRLRMRPGPRRLHAPRQLR